VATGAALGGVAEISAPITGVVEAVNGEVFADPAGVTKNPFDTWLVRIKGTVEMDELMSSGEYAAFLES
jgi:glycine cleavage system H lipoate-binding protein